MTTIENGDSSSVPLRDTLCCKAVEHFGRFGFDESMLEMSIVTDTDVGTLTELFGSVEGMRAACDDYLQATIAAAKTGALVSPDPSQWRAEIACRVDAIQYETDLEDDECRHLEDSAAFFTTVLPGRDTALGNPGGAMSVGRVGADTPLVAAMPARPRHRDD